MIEHHSFTVEESQLRLDQYLVWKLPDYSRSKIQNLIKLGQVTINGEPAKSSLILLSSFATAANSIAIVSLAIFFMSDKDFIK